MSRKSQQTDQRKQRFLWIAGGIVLLLLAIYFIQQNAVANKSTLSIAPTGEEASVFIDRTRAQTLQSTSTPTDYNVSTGNHQILVAYDGYWPWTDEVTVSGSGDTQVSPFLIEQTGRRVLQTTSNILESLATAENQPVPSQAEPLISKTENVEVFIENESNIIARWNGDESDAPDFFSCDDDCRTVVYSQKPVHQISFYPNRDDVIFFATATGVYAIEIDPTGSTQNFQPVVEAVSNPVFTISDGNIFVQAGDRITVSDI